MTSNVLCKYYMNGCCAYGEGCRFSHDMGDMPNQVCKFYLEGSCAYGDRCRYDHVRPSWSQQQRQQQPGNGGDAAGPSGRPPPLPRPRVSSSNGNGNGAAAAAAAAAASAAAVASIYKLPSGADELGMIESSDPHPDWDEGGGGGGDGGGYDGGGGGSGGVYGSWEEDGGHGGGGDGYGAHGGYDDGSGYGAYANGGYCGGDGDDGDVVDPADIPLCPEYERTGHCQAGEECALVHGDACEDCGAHCLHPYNEAAAAAHREACGAAAARRERWARDRGVECGICLERVLDKPDPSARRFGLMACEHSFCLSCIRAWRATDDVDVDTALRTCPICRTTTHFITPSATWPATPEEKDAVVRAYKAKMAAIDCLHFDYGDGACPFGTSCFYRHALRDGRPAPLPELRRAADDEGAVRVLRPVTLSAFLDTPAAQRLLSAAPRRRLASRR